MKPMLPRRARALHLRHTRGRSEARASDDYVTPTARLSLSVTLVSHPRQRVEPEVEDVGVGRELGELAVLCGALVLQPLSLKVGVLDVAHAVLPLAVTPLALNQHVHTLRGVHPPVARGEPHGLATLLAHAAERQQRAVGAGERVADLTHQGGGAPVGLEPVQHALVPGQLPEHPVPAGLDHYGHGPVELPLALAHGDHRHERLLDEAEGGFGAPEPLEVLAEREQARVVLLRRGGHDGDRRRELLAVQLVVEVLPSLQIPD
eukprot:1176867-Prorocentrum_minimum.AAC.4